MPGRLMANRTNAPTAGALAVAAALPTEPVGWSLGAARRGALGRMRMPYSRNTPKRKSQECDDCRYRWLSITILSAPPRMALLSDLPARSAQGAAVGRTDGCRLGARRRR